MTVADRRAHGNGIWLCQIHAKAIDDDRVRFTKELLTAWRRRAEEIAAEELGKPAYEGTLRRLIPHNVRLGSDLSRLHERIEQFLIDIGVPVAWGNHYGAVRMALYELALNAIRYGGVSDIQLESRDGRVCMRYAGTRFGLQELLKSGRGGQAAVVALNERASGSLELVYEWRGGQNEWSIVDQVLDPEANNPCALKVEQPGYLGANKAVSDLPGLDGCDEIHVYPPRLWSYSDFYALYEQIRGQLRERVLVLHGVDPGSGLGELVLRNVPNARLPDRGSAAYVVQH